MQIENIYRGGEAPPSLTEWPNEPDVRTLKMDAETARPSHSVQMAKIGNWNDLLNATGKFKPSTVKGRSSVQPKLARQQAEWRYSALSEPFLGSNKIFSVKPTTFEDELGARQNELVLNWQFRSKFNRVKLVDDMIRATVDEGTCILRVGWKRVTTTVMEEVPVWNYFAVESEEQLQALQQAIEAREENIRGFTENADPATLAAVEYYRETGEAVYAMQAGTDLVPTERLVENRPTVEVLNPQNVMIDPSCNGDYSKAMFTILSFETCKADLMKEPDRYKNLEYVLWESSSPANESDHASNTPTDFQFQDELRKKVVAYEYWGFHDINDDGKLVPIVATWIGSTMIRCEENPYPDQKLPFVVIPYLPVKRDLYGEPDAELLEDSQNIAGAITRGMIDLLGRSANSQQGMAKGMLDTLNKRRFENGQDYEFNPAQNPASNLIEHKYPEIPQSAMIMLNLQNQQAESLTGVKAFTGGISGEAFGDVAAGIRGVLDAASKREMAILRRLAHGMCTVASKVTAMNAVFLSEKEVIRVTNQEYVTILREDLDGNFDFEVDIATAEIDNARAQDLAFMLQTVGPNADPGIMMMILAEIADLKRMPGLANKLRRWKPEPSPEEQELQRLAIEKAQAEVDKLKSEIALNEAKAAEALASRDQKNLDYVEQESGTKHARDMEKQKAQSQGNQNLQVTKALTAPSKEGEQRPNIEAAIGFNQLSDKLGEAGQPTNPGSMIDRDQQALLDPTRSLGSAQFDPTTDPAMNPSITI